jgi:hypothetical protein
MIPICESTYAEFFSDDDRAKVFLLDEIESAHAFEASLGLGVGSFFDLPDTHWIVIGRMILVGTWIESYNADLSDSVSRILRSKIDWRETDAVHFFVNKRFAIKTSWKVFSKSWDAFLAIHDDCPLLMRATGEKEALIFTALGDIRYVVHRG